MEKLLQRYQMTALLFHALLGIFHYDHNLVGRENCEHNILDRSFVVTNSNSDINHLFLCWNAAAVSLHAIHSPMK
jgi:hypothetical protein